MADAEAWTVGSVCRGPPKARLTLRCLGTNDRDKNKRAFVVVPTLFSPCAYERHAL